MEITKLYPVQNCEFEENEEGIITVLYKKEKLSFIERIFFKKLSEKPYKVDLDKLGSFVWKLCDGKLSIEEITEKLKTDYSEDVESAEERVKLFVQQLHKNKFVNLYEKK